VGKTTDIRGVRPWRAMGFAAAVWMLGPLAHAAPCKPGLTCPETQQQRQQTPRAGQAQPALVPSRQSEGPARQRVLPTSTQQQRQPPPGQAQPVPGLPHQSEEPSQRRVVPTSTQQQRQPPGQAQPVLGLPHQSEEPSRQRVTRATRNRMPAIPHHAMWRRRPRRVPTQRRDRASQVARATSAPPAQGRIRLAAAWHALTASHPLV